LNRASACHENTMLVIFQTWPLAKYHCYYDVVATISETLHWSMQLMKMLELGNDLSEQERQNAHKLSRIANLLQIRTLALDSLVILFDAA